MPKNKIHDPAEIVRRISELYEYFRLSRAYFPYISDSDIGKPSLTKNFNLADGTKMKITINQPITEEFQLKNNAVGHFLNQNFLIRLYSVLDYYDIYLKLNKNLAGFYSVDLLRRLRHKFGHSLGKYDSCDSDNVKLMESMVAYFPLPDKNPLSYSDYPLNIDKVIPVIIGESIQYVKQLFQIEKI